MTSIITPKQPLTLSSSTSLTCKSSVNLLDHPLHEEEDAHEQPHATVDNALEDYEKRKAEKFETEGEEEYKNEDECCKCHDYLHLMVMDMFLKLEYL